MKIQDIAGAVGFSDASHFIAMFRKITGITPLDFQEDVLAAYAIDKKIRQEISIELNNS